jgi:hypothetical protein
MKNIFFIKTYFINICTIDINQNISLNEDTILFYGIIVFVICNFYNTLLTVFSNSRVKNFILKNFSKIYSNQINILTSYRVKDPRSGKIIELELKEDLEHNKVLIIMKEVPPENGNKGKNKKKWNTKSIVIAVTITAIGTVVFLVTIGWYFETKLFLFYKYEKLFFANS